MFIFKEKDKDKTDIRCVTVDDFSVMASKYHFISLRLRIGFWVDENFFCRVLNSLTMFQLPTKLQKYVIAKASLGHGDICLLV